jgi:ribosome-associated protein
VHREPDDLHGDVVVVTARVRIPRTELVVRATKSGGPGGQHVNTSSTRIELTWVPGSSVALDDAQRARVATALAARLDSQGRLRIVSSEHRSQLQNREAAEARLAALVRGALVVPRPRRPTKPTAASKRARLEDKSRRASVKRERRQRDFE